MFSAGNNILKSNLQFVLVYDEQKNLDAESKKAVAKAQEQEKTIKKPTVKASDSAAVSSEMAPVPNKKRTGDKVEKATDDFFYEKFRKRARDSWRYQ